MRGNRQESSPERALRSALHRRGLRFRKHVSPVPGLRCRPDVVFPGRHLAVFVDGCFWHRCPLHCRAPQSNAAWWEAKLDGNVERDRRHDEALRAAGWEVLRVWEHEPVELAAERVITAWEGRAPLRRTVP